MAVQQDRDSWMRQRLAGEVASGRVKRTANVDAFLQNKPMPGNKPIGDVFGQLTRDLAKLDKQINANIHASEGDKKKKGPSLSAVKKAAKEGRTLYASQPSTCFTEVSWTDGVCTFSFAHKTIMDVDVPMDLQEFLDLASEPSLGQAWNRDYYGA
jgi:hypothetical protein